MSFFTVASPPTHESKHASSASSSSSSSSSPAFAPAGVALFGGAAGAELALGELDTGALALGAGAVVAAGAFWLESSPFETASDD
jgi:hypothetical protein